MSSFSERLVISNFPLFMFLGQIDKMPALVQFGTCIVTKGPMFPLEFLTFYKNGIRTSLPHCHVLLFSGELVSKLSSDSQESI